MLELRLPLSWGFGPVLLFHAITFLILHMVFDRHLPTCMAWEGRGDFRCWLRMGRLRLFFSEDGGGRGFPAEALVFCSSQAPCRCETPEAGEGERTLWIRCFTI